VFTACWRFSRVEINAASIPPDRSRTASAAVSGKVDVRAYPETGCEGAYQLFEKKLRSNGGNSFDQDNANLELENQLKPPRPEKPSRRGGGTERGQPSGTRGRR
jgi:hypothetical protein